MEPSSRASQGQQGSQPPKPCSKKLEKIRPLGERGEAAAFRQGGQQAKVAEGLGRRPAPKARAEGALEFVGLFGRH
jgi:hypothetical protein